MNIRKVSKDFVIRGILKNGIEEILYIERELSYQWRLQVILSFGSSDSGIIVVRVKPREQPQGFELSCIVVWIEYYWIKVPW